MKKGISMWSLPERNPDVCFPYAKKLGYDGIEIAIGNEGPVRFDSTKQELQDLCQKAKDYGIAFYSLVCDTCWDSSISSSVPEICKRAEQTIIKQLETASVLGCDTILVIAGMVKGLKPAYNTEVVRYDVAYDRALESVTKLSEYAKKYGVAIGIENVGNKLLLSPLEMRDFIDKCGSPWVKAYLDVGNTIRNGYPEHWIDILGSRIAKVHFKDLAWVEGTNALREVNILDGLVDYPEVMAALCRVGYDDWVTAEIFPKHANDKNFLYENSVAMDKILNRI